MGRRNRRQERRIGSVLVISLLVVLAACGGSDDGNWETRFWWGAHVAPAGEETRRQAIERFDDGLGEAMTAARIYRRWEDRFPTDDHRWLAKQRRLVVLSIKPIRANGERIAWTDIAAAQIGSPVYTELVDWAQRVRKFKRPIYVVLHHEPETDDDIASGTSADFVAAWQRFAEIIRAEAGPKARLMWIMTDASFTTASEPWQGADLWYPGDELVDAIGVDAFNWFDCRGQSEAWRSLETLADPARDFAARHPDKEFWITEFGTATDPQDAGRRDAWLAEAAALPTKRGWEQLRGMLHFDDVMPELPDCDWRLGSDGSSMLKFGELSTVPREPATTVSQPEGS
jgi:hypothetical protein